jgi:acyl-CoA synthetase (NDP forming)
MFLRSLLYHEFQGNVYPVNSRESEVMGLKAYPSILNIPDDVDLAVVTIPGQAVPEVIEQCVQKKVKFVIIHTAGFAEVGLAGLAIQEKILRGIEGKAIRIVGPNCMGIFCPESKINMIVPFYGLLPEFTPPSLDVGDISFMGQSGWSNEAFILEGNKRGLRCSKVVSIGNQLDLTIADYLEYFGADPNTRLIGAYVEGMKDGQIFLERAREVSRHKPIIVWKGGRTNAGARAAASHTGALASSSAICEGAFKQVGIIEAQSLWDIMDTAVAFAAPYLPQGRRVGILSEAGGGAVASADLCEAYGLEVPTLSPDVQDELRKIFDNIYGPSFSAVKNPVDPILWPPWDKYSYYFSSLKSIARDVDVLLVITYHPLNDEDFIPVAEEVRDAVKKPIFVVHTFPSTQARGLELCTVRGIPAYPTVEGAIKGISGLTQYAQYLRMS